MQRSEGLFRIKEKIISGKEDRNTYKVYRTIKNSTLMGFQGIKHSSFATSVEEKLSGLNKRLRTIAEKRINDVLFELEMSAGNESIDRNIQPFQIQ